MSLTIRPAAERDIEELLHLFERYRNFYKQSADHPGARAFLLERMRKKESVIHIAILENQIIGFTQLYPLFSSLHMKRTWLLNDLYVLAEHRGKGISKRLLETAKQLARQTSAAGIILETQKTNIIGNSLYPSCGFVLYGSNNFYWWQTQAAPPSS
jgi:GNAT superfamily N-acetyltransferase